MPTDRERRLEQLVELQLERVLEYLDGYSDDEPISPDIVELLVLAFEPHVEIVSRLDCTVLDLRRRIVRYRGKLAAGEVVVRP